MLFTLNMKDNRVLLQLVLLVALHYQIGSAQGSALPQVSIVWPDSSTRIRPPLCLKIKVDAESPAGAISEVRFLAQTNNLIGVVTNPPFSLVWEVGMGITNHEYNPLVLTAVATDTTGLSATSAPVILPIVIEPPTPVLQLASPKNGAIFATTDTILFTAELLASMCDTGPEEFLIDTNSIGILNQNGSNEMFTAATPLFSTYVSNLAEGDYQFRVRYLGFDGGLCTCGSAQVRVTRLGLAWPRLGTNGNVNFDVVTSFVGKPNIIEYSTNLLDWIPMTTNQPSTTTFTFEDPSPITVSRRFYRAKAPAD